MECFTPTVSFYLFTNNYFTSFCFFVCLTTFEQEVFPTKIVYANALSLGINNCKKRNVATLKSVANLKQKRCVTCVASCNDRRFLYIASSESCQSNRNLFDIGTKLKENIFKSNNQVSSTVTTTIWILTKEWIRTRPNTALVSNEKMVMVPF